MSLQHIIYFNKYIWKRKRGKYIYCWYRCTLSLKFYIMMIKLCKNSEQSLTKRCFVSKNCYFTTEPTGFYHDFERGTLSHQNQLKIPAFILFPCRLYILLQIQFFSTKILPATIVKSNVFLLFFPPYPADWNRNSLLVY